MKHAFTTGWRKDRFERTGVLSVQERSNLSGGSFENRCLVRTPYGYFEWQRREDLPRSFLNLRAADAWSHDEVVERQYAYRAQTRLFHRMFDRRKEARRRL